MGAPVVSRRQIARELLHMRLGTLVSLLALTLVFCLDKQACRGTRWRLRRGEVRIGISRIVKSENFPDMNAGRKKFWKKLRVKAKSPGNVKTEENDQEPKEDQRLKVTRRIKNRIISRKNGSKRKLEQYTKNAASSKIRIKLTKENLTKTIKESTNVSTESEKSTKEKKVIPDLYMIHGGIYSAAVNNNKISRIKQTKPNPASNHTQDLEFLESFLKSYRNAN